MGRLLLLLMTLENAANMQESSVLDTFNLIMITYKLIGDSHQSELPTKLQNIIVNILFLSDIISNSQVF